MPDRARSRRSGAVRRLAVGSAGVLLGMAMLGACSDDGGEEGLDVEALSARCEEFATDLEDPLVYLLEDVARLEQAAAGTGVDMAQFEGIRNDLTLLSEQDQRYVTWATCMSNLDPPEFFTCGPKDPDEDYLVARNEVCSPFDPDYRDIVVENPMPHGPFPTEEPVATEAPATTGS